MARTKNKTRNDTKTRRTHWRNSHLEKKLLLCVLKHIFEPFVLMPVCELFVLNSAYSFVCSRNRKKYVTCCACISWSFYFVKMQVAVCVCFLQTNCLGESGWGRKRRDAILDRRFDQMMRVAVPSMDTRETTVNRDKRQSENFDIDVGGRVKIVEKYTEIRN